MNPFAIFYPFVLDKVLYCLSLEYFYLLCFSQELHQGLPVVQVTKLVIEVHQGQEIDGVFYFVNFFQGILSCLLLLDFIFGESLKDLVILRSYFKHGTVEWFYYFCVVSMGSRPLVFIKVYDWSNDLTI